MAVTRQHRESWHKAAMRTLKDSGGTGWSGQMRKLMMLFASLTCARRATWKDLLNRVNNLKFQIFLTIPSAGLSSRNAKNLLLFDRANRNKTCRWAKHQLLGSGLTASTTVSPSYQAFNQPTTCPTVPATRQCSRSPSSLPSCSPRRASLSASRNRSL